MIIDIVSFITSYKIVNSKIGGFREAQMGVAKMNQ